MAKGKSLIIGILCILLLSVSYGLEADADLISFWEFENDLTDTQGSYDFLTDSGLSYVAGHDGQAADFDGTDWAQASPINFGTDFSVCAWVNYDAGNQNEVAIAMDNRSGTEHKTFAIQQLNSEADALWGYAWDESEDGFDGYKSIGLSIANKWYFLCLSVDGGTANFYINGSLGASAIPSGVFNEVDDWTSKLTIGACNNCDGASFDRAMDGQLDTLSVWDRALSQADIQDMQANGITGVGGTLSLNTDLVNNTDPTNVDPWSFNINGSAVGMSEIVNLSVYVNDVLNNTYLDMNITKGLIFNVSTTNTTAWFNVSFNASGGAITDESGYYYYYFDTINPIFTTLTGIVNGTTYFRNGSAENFNWNTVASDINLFAVNYTLRHSNGTVFFNVFEENLTSSTYTNNTAFSINDYAIGTYYVNFKLWDDHNYKIEKHEKADSIYKDTSNLKLTFKGKTIDINSPDVNGYEVYDEDNKYRIEYKFKKKENNIIYLDNADDWQFRSTKHKAHFVNYKLSKYYDLDSPDLHVKNIKRVDNRWEIKVDVDKLSVKTQSIGDLNEYETEYTIYVDSGFSITAQDLWTSQSISNFTIYVFNPGNETLLANDTTTTGTLIFNITGNFTTNFTSPLYTDNSSSTIEFIPGDSFEYGVFAKNSFKISFYNELTLELLNNTNVTLDIISDSYSANYSTSTGELIITALAPTTYTFRYFASGFQPRISTYTLTNSTSSELDLYLLVGGVNVTTYVYDQDTSPVEGATIKTYRYSVESNSYVLINTVNTDFEGKTVTNLQPNTEFYKFFIYYNSELKKETLGALITGTELTFEINTETPINQDYYTLQDIDGYVSFNENSLNFRFYFDDGSLTVDQGCLEVYKVGINSETLHNDQCTAGASALILVNATNVTNQKYTAYGYVYIDGEKTLFDTYSYTFVLDNLYGNFGIIIVILLTILMGTMALWDIPVSLILLPIPTLIGSLPAIHWINLPLEYAIGLEVIMIVLAFLIRKR